MNRRKFALSWGRKLFFGLSWPLTLVIGLFYLKSYIIPGSVSDFLYYFVTYLGHFGLMNALVYFLLYCPITLLMPTYYVSRLWSLLLILSLNFLVLVDAIIFSTYEFHLYSFIGKFLLEQGLSTLPNVTKLIFALSLGFLILGAIIWIRGERIWRYMQGRFSNPVKNWYLFLIIFCLIMSKSIYHFGAVDSRLSTVFPLNLNFKREEHFDKEIGRRVYYPSKEITCTEKANPNLVIITLEKWEQGDLNQEMMPLVFHMKKHAVTYNSHYSVGSGAKEGFFSLYYSIPASYSTILTEKKPAIISELNKRNYEVVSIKEGYQNSEKSFQSWLISRDKDEMKPFFLNLILEQSPVEADKMIQFIIDSLQSKGLLKNTEIILTGGFSSKESGYKVPLLVFNIDRRSGEVHHPTSHYDVIPTAMENLWNCKGMFQSASIGKPLSDKERDWLLLQGSNGFKILDFQRSILTSIENDMITDEFLAGKSHKPRRDLILKALKLNLKFTRP